MTNCKICNAEAKQKCSGCFNVFYCSRNCQVTDWKNGHKNDCKPYEVKRNSKLGRYTIASRDLKAGEVLFREVAVVHGPKMLSNPICLGCHKALVIKSKKTDFYRCSRCSWPLCSKQCERLDPHIDECNLMSSKNYKSPIKVNCLNQQSDAIYCLIFPLRFLILKLKQPKVFEKILSELESHVDERIASGSYDSHKHHLVPFIQKLLDPNVFTEHLILTATAILDNNCFEISMPLRGIEMGGLFLISLILCHDCVPNTKHYVNYVESDSDIQRYQMTFETTVPVKKGEQLTTTYTDTLKTTLERRKHLKQTKIFDCDCKRCMDASELSTYGSSWRCQRCFNGLIVSTNSLNNNSEWHCESCNAVYSCEDISGKLNRLQIQLRTSVNRQPESLEKFLVQTSDEIHGNHLLIIEVKYMLCLMYGNIGGYHYKELSENLLQRKIDLCNNVLDIYNTVHPGRTDQRMNIIFELNCAKIIDMKTKLSKNLINKTNVMHAIDQCLKQIKDCYDVLVLEMENKGIMDKRLERIMNESFM
ncbi:SET domain-containing protein SmydA-8-like [Chironomus tepperi]|uniref:SET domain-containing protein SmydA-8-like n=1 Tax=Chironomus tepperi TaxID=113505 RepID=UPI00391F5773